MKHRLSIAGKDTDWILSFILFRIKYSLRVQLNKHLNQASQLMASCPSMFVLVIVLLLILMTVIAENHIE